MTEPHSPYLEPTFFIDADAGSVQDMAAEIAGGLPDPAEKAKAIFYWTRDRIRYSPYAMSTDPADYKASSIIDRGIGWCVQKACVLAALLRAAGIPSRLGFADIRNFQTTAKLKNLMQTDIFFYHGYAELLINRKWLKATPAFNREMCEKFGHMPVEFDGHSNALLPETSLDGQPHITYINDRGTFADLPFEDLFATFHRKYPSMVF